MFRIGLLFKHGHDKQQRGACLHNIIVMPLTTAVTRNVLWGSLWTAPVHTQCSWSSSGTAPMQQGLIVYNSSSLLSRQSTALCPVLPRPSWQPLSSMLQQLEALPHAQEDSRTYLAARNTAIQNRLILPRSSAFSASLPVPSCTCRTSARTPARPTEQPALTTLLHAASFLSFA